MSNNQKRTSCDSRHANHPLPPAPPARQPDASKMFSFQPEFSASPNRPETAFSPSVGSSMVPGTSVLPSHTIRQHHFHYGSTRGDYRPARPEQASQSNMNSTMQLMFEPSPPGIYPSDMTVPRRPPMIIEETIKDYKERMAVSGRNQSGRHGKDIHRHLRVVHVIGEFIREHNEVNREDPYMLYRWYETDRSDSTITATLLAIIEDTAHALIPHLYSRFTYNDAQRRDCASMESMVARVASHKMFDPLTQTLRAFGIRRLIQEKMATKKKTMDRRRKRMGQNERPNDLTVNVPLSLTPRSDEATLTVPDLPSETHAIVNSSDCALSMEAVCYQPINAPGEQREVQKQFAESHALERQPGIKNTLIQSRLPGASKQTTEISNLENTANIFSADCEKSPQKPRGKVKKSKGKNVASKGTKRTSKLHVKTSTVSRARVESGEHQTSGLTNPSKPRKRKQIENEAPDSDSVADSTDSEKREAELLELKKRVKEIEKRSGNKKGKKRSRQ